MIDVERFREVLCDLADELPPEFFTRLNGGVILSEEVKLDESSRGEDPLYVLGEYRHSREMGRDIVLYYGSFRETFPEHPFVLLKNEMRKTLRHEFRHHLESLAGENALEKEDAQNMADYLARFGD